MIVVQLLGGLGNQLFQYAIGRRLAHDYNVPLKLDISAYKNDKLRTYRLKYFNIIEDFARPNDMWHLNGLGLSPRLMRAFERYTHIRLLRKQKIVRESDSQDVFKLGANIYLEGYWQGEKYFKSIEPLIRKDFSFKIPPNAANKEMADLIPTIPSVSIHIRRGDYASNPAARALHGLLPIEYYQKAAEKIAATIQGPQFFIFSDDPEWARNNLKLAYPVTLVDQNNAETDYEDLRLLSLCQHHIIANSTFSWWGAWLCSNPDKIIYAPAKWYNQPEIQNTDIVPAAWQRITI